MWRRRLHDCQCDTDNGYDETFQNEGEESEAKERKGTRPGVVRCSYCVKQGNVVSTRSLLISQCVALKKKKKKNLWKPTEKKNVFASCFSEKELEEKVFHSGW